jgi:hypothetical protein
MAFAPDQKAYPLLDAIARTSSLAALSKVVADQPLNLTPPTDNNPYFFNMLRLSHLNQFLRSEPGVVRGNLVATGTLVILIGALTVLTVLLVLVPLWAKHDTDRGSLAGAGMAYFVAVGAGFMFVELGMTQRLSVFLGHPVYALGVLLATIIASAGAGSFLSDRLPLRVTATTTLSLGCAALALAFAYVADGVASHMIDASRSMRIVVTVAMVAPVGVVMGMFVPVGLRLTRRIHGRDTPWYWALNGVVSVLCSALAVLVAITSGVHANFVVGSLAYLATTPALAALVRQNARSRA